MFRLDRLLTIYFFYPLLRMRILGGTRGIPILMYHSISEGRDENVHPYYETNTSPKTFEAHIRFLHENNYQVIPLEQAVQILGLESSLRHTVTEANKSHNPTSLCNSSNPMNPSNPVIQTPNRLLTREICVSNSEADFIGASKPDRPNRPDRPNEPNNSYVVLTFDDGFEDFYTEAFPILQSRGFACSVYLPTAAIGNSEPGLKKKKHLSWNQVRELNSSGVSFGSHTVNHPQLGSLPDKTIKMELSKSKEEIEQQLGEKISSFSYPYAFPEEKKQFSKRLKELLLALDYEIGVTTKIGLSVKEVDPFFLKRIPVNDFDDLAFLKAKIEGAYDWLGAFQKLSKLSKKILKG